MSTITVNIEGAPRHLEDREYTGAELRELGGLGPRDKLVREEPDGSETAIPPARRVQVSPNDNFFASVRHRRG